MAKFAFQKGDTVILVAAPADDPARDRGYWNPLMDLFVGNEGEIKYVDTSDHSPYSLVYEVQFDPMTDGNGLEIRDYWFCKEEWLCRAEDKEVDTSSIDNFFSEF